MSPSPTHSHETFEQIAEKAKHGDRTAQGQLLEIIRRPLMYYIRKRKANICAQNWQRDSDVVQEAFLKAIEEIEKAEGCTLEQVLAWVRAIVDNKILDERRRLHARKRDVGREISIDSPGFQESMQDAAPSAEETAIRHEESQIIRDLLAGFLPEYAEIIRMRAERCSWVEIGRVIGRSPEAVRKLHMRVVAELGEKFNALP